MLSSNLYAVDLRIFLNPNLIVLLIIVFSCPHTGRSCIDMRIKSKRAKM